MDGLKALGTDEPARRRDTISDAVADHGVPQTLEDDLMDISSRDSDEADDADHTLPAAEMRRYAHDSVVPSMKENAVLRDSSLGKEVEATHSGDGTIDQRLEDYLALRATKFGTKPEIDRPNSNGETENDTSEEPEDDDESVQREDISEPVFSSKEMEAQRQQMLRDIAAHDRIGGDYMPEAKHPTELVARLTKQRDRAIQIAKDRRGPFEKFQDFDAFIDEVTLTDDQSWKTLHIQKNV